MEIAALAGGSFIVLGVLIVGFFVVIPLSYFTKKGSGIYEHPHGKIYSGAPGAIGPGSSSGHDGREHNWSRGTR